MRSGWPNTQGYSNQEYWDGDYRYDTGQQTQLPPVNQGAHPYAAFSADGYGDDGYRDPGYQGPAAQDAGIAGTRTVRGYVEQGQHAGYPAQPGYAQPGYAEPGYAPAAYAEPGYGPQGGYVQNGYPAAGHPSGAYPAQSFGPQSYAGSSYVPGGEIELAYPAPVTGERQAAWDYDRQYRYGDEASQYPGGYQDQGGYSAPYNGSEYSRPGVDGPGYDLSGIIGASDFDQVDYDRLSYDDPRYDSPAGGPNGRPRFDETRYDMPVFDDAGLERLWLSGEDVRGADPVGYGNDGFGGTSYRSSSADLDLGSGGVRFDETRFDLNVSGELARMDHTRYDVPAFHDTRMNNMRALGPGSASLDSFGSFDDSFDGLDLAEDLAPAAFTRTLERPEAGDTAGKRGSGRRRGGSGDRRQWMALGAIAVVAAGAIGGVLMKFHFSGASGPSHSIAAPAKVDGYTRNAELEKTMKVGDLAKSVASSTNGQASSLASAVYSQGTTMSGSEQMYMFVGGKLAGADPSASIANFKQAYPGAAQVPTGTYGGDAACTEAHMAGQKGQVAMCVWFDNDTFGAMVSSTMSPAKLATTMAADRPSLERVAK